MGDWRSSGGLLLVVVVVVVVDLRWHSRKTEKAIVWANGFKNCEQVAALAEASGV